MRRGRGRPLGIALLAAVLVHGLGLTYAGLRNNRSARLPEAAKMPDDTPELLRFSRRAPQTVALNTIPLPPPSLLPPPPPANLLAPKALGPGAKATAPRRKTAPTRAPMARMPAAKKPAAVPQAAAVAALPAAAGLAAARNALEALRTAPAGESKEATALRELWGQAERVEEAGLGEGMELRRLAAGKAKELGLTAGEPRGGRSDGVLLVAWLEGEQVWLLQAAAESGGAG
jgi:hypothetical protein